VLPVVCLEFSAKNAYLIKFFYFIIIFLELEFQEIVFVKTTFGKNECIEKILSSPGVCLLEDL